MNVTVTVNENYIYPLKVMLHSLFSTQQEPVTVYLLHTQIPPEKIEMLKTFCVSYGAELSEVRIENDRFEHAPVMQHFSKEMYYRLLSPWLLPEVDRVLYLDPDMIINAPLSDLYHMNFDGASLAAGRDRPTGIDHIKRLGLKPDAVYINSGVLLMDLSRMREEMQEDEIWDVLKNREKELLFPDQDMINILWEGKIRLLKDAYNLNVNILYLKEYLMSRRKKKSLWKIMHYIGPEKPWNKGYRGGCYSFWAKQEWKTFPEKRGILAGRLALTPWRFVYGLYLFWKNHHWKK